LIMSSLLFAAILESRSTPVCNDKRENSATRRIDKALAYDDKASGKYIYLDICNRIATLRSLYRALGAIT
jgi:hypothetical protein